MNGRHYNYQYSNKHARLAIWFFVLLGVLFALGLIFRPQKLISPLDGIDGLSTDFRPAIAEAHEREVKISCDNPKGYLECQVYKGVITWNDHDKLSKIIQCESNWNPEALNENTNGSFDLGLFQINTIHKVSRYEMLNFRKNIDFGIKLYKKQGVRPWVCARKLEIK